jgi:signal transduction histidine kinase
MKTIFKRLNTRIIVYFLSFSFLPLLIFSIFGYHLNKDLITRINKNNLHSLNSGYAKELNLYFKYKRHIIERAFIDYQSSEKTRSLQSFLEENDGLKSNFIGLQSLSISNKETDKNEMKNFSLMDSFPSVLYKTRNVIIAGGLPLEEIRDLIGSDLKDIQNTVYFLISEKKMNGNSFEAFDKAENGIIEKRIEDWNSGLKDAVIEDSGYLLSYTWIGKYDILILTKVDAQSFYSELMAFRNKILMANIIFALILITLAIIYSRRITTPIHKLIDATNRIGRGDMDKKIQLTTNDEIQILANEFELMRQKLQGSYQEMEEKIQKRTRELQQAQAQISHQEKMASLGMMAAGIAHEIGNPLTSISSMVQIIKRKNDDPKTNEYISNILKNIERISRIVRELVDFSRPSSYEEAPADINEIIKSAVGIIKYDRRAKNLIYQMILDSDLPETVLVSDHLLQVFLNILINAVDASEGYGNEIEVKSYAKNGIIHVNIADKGCGIPEEMQNRIFEPFFTTKEVGKGTGLGLTVSYGFIKKLNGEIKVKSNVGSGSTFFITIPIRIQTEE